MLFNKNLCKYTLKMAVLCLWSAVVLPVFAHTPQHVVDSLRLSPDYQHDQTVFTLIQNRLLKSNDGGYEWRELVYGLDSKYSYSSLAVSPGYAEDKTVFVSSDGGGIFKTMDGGANWEKSRNGLESLNIGFIEISPQYVSDGLVLAAGARGGLYLSLDKGQAWKSVLSGDVLITSISFSESKLARKIVVGDSDGGLWLSPDAGEHWTQKTTLQGSGRITSLTMADNVIYIGTEKQGLFKTLNDGVSFISSPGGPSEDSIKCSTKSKVATTGRHVVSVALSPHFHKNKIMFAANWYDALYKSIDGGDTWVKIVQGLTCDPQANAHKLSVPHYRDIRLSSSFEEDGTVFLAAFDGLFKSTDFGETWQQLETLPVRLIRGLTASPASNGRYSLSLNTYGGGSYQSKDNGVSWHSDNVGLRTTRLSDIKYSPNYHDDGYLFTASSQRFLRKHDNDRRWGQVKLGYFGWRVLAAKYLSKVGVAKSSILDKSERDYVWPMSIAPSPEYANDKTIFMGTRRHGVVKSIDSGDSWTDKWKGPEGFILSLAISPSYTVDKTLFAAVRGHGIYKTTDAGLTWFATNDGFQFLADVKYPDRSNYTIDPVLFASIKEVYVAISPHYSVDQTLYAISADGLFKTTDAGGSWHPIQSHPDLTDGKITALAISPSYGEDQQLVIYVLGRGLYLSKDGGESFSLISSTLDGNNQLVRWIQFSPLYAEDQTLYVASEEQLYKTTNAGSSWSQVHRPVRYEDYRGEGKGPVRFSEGWKLDGRASYSASMVHETKAVGGKARLDFVGSGVTWIGHRGPSAGIAKVYIDGKLIEKIDLYQPASSLGKVFEISDLERAHHVIVVESTGERNAQSKGSRVTVDAFDIPPQ